MGYTSVFITSVRRNGVFAGMLSITRTVLLTHDHTHAVVGPADPGRCYELTKAMNQDGSRQG